MYDSDGHRQFAIGYSPLHFYFLLILYIRDQLSKPFNSCNILTLRHSIWISKNYFAGLQLMKVSHDLTYSLNNQGQTDFVLLGLLIKFHTNQLLLTKLKHYEIRGNVLNLISDFLLLRTQRVMCRVWRFLFQTD